MIKNPELINAINNKKLSVDRISFATTRKCNLECAHCFRGDAQKEDMVETVPETALSAFSTVGSIDVTGGEPLIVTRSLEQLHNAIRDTKTKFNKLNIITNGTVYNKKAFEILESIGGMAQSGGGVSVGISDNIWTDEAIKKIGYTKEQIIENMNKLKQAFPSFDVHRHDRVRVPVYGGRAKGKMNGGIEFRGRETGISFSDGLTENGDFLLDNLYLDTRGNVVQRYLDYNDSDKENYGNILDTRLQDILIKHGVGDVTLPENERLDPATKEAREREQLMQFLERLGYAVMLPQDVVINGKRLGDENTAGQ